MSEQSSSSPRAHDIEFMVMNTKMAADRTLLGWVSTTVSLISFGFAIYEVINRYHVKSLVVPRGDAALNIGMFLVVLGTGGILMGIISYLRTLRRLRPWHEFGVIQPPIIMAVSMACLSLFICALIIVTDF